MGGNWDNHPVGQIMKALLIAAALLGLLPLLASAEDNGKPTAAQEAVAKIKRTFPYDAAASQRSEEKQGSDDDVIVMEAFKVTASLEHRHLREEIDKETQKRRDEQFSIIKGGAIFRMDVGKTRIEFGIWGAGAGLNILRISW
jgi:hypothetical protein